MIDYPWQDLGFMAGSIVFAVTLWLAVREPGTTMPRWKTSVPTAITLYWFTVIYFTLEFWFSMAVTFLTAMAWSAVAIWRAPKDS